MNPFAETLPSSSTSPVAVCEVQEISFADFCDPDGNRWVLQERGYRNPVYISLNEQVL